MRLKFKSLFVSSMFLALSIHASLASAAQAIFINESKWTMEVEYTLGEFKNNNDDGWSYSSKKYLTIPAIPDLDDKTTISTRPIPPSIKNYTIVDVPVPFPFNVIKMISILSATAKNKRGETIAKTIYSSSNYDYMYTTCERSVTYMTFVNKIEVNPPVNIAIILKDSGPLVLCNTSRFFNDIKR